jgi:hypothetical protein
MEVTRTDTGEAVLNGMPIWNIFLCDLTGDGTRELCATVSFGSGIVDNHIIVADLTTGEQHTLWERGEYDYTLHLEQGELLCEKRSYRTGALVEKGQFALGMGSFVPWTPGIREAEMLPTEAGLRGAFDSYLYLERDGKTYRYEQAELDAESITKGKLLDTFTEPAYPDNVIWKIYAIEGRGDREVLAEVNRYELFRYVYSPPKASSEAELERVKPGCVVLEDGEPTHGQEIWQTFYEHTRKGEPASVKVAAWYTLDEANCDARYYAAYKEDYPALYVQELVFDGEKYTLYSEGNGEKIVREYEYLMRYETELPSTASSQKPGTQIRYVLTHSDTVTWDDLWRGMISSQFGAYMDHYTIYKE